jgi:TPR repeat protein
MSNLLEKEEKIIAFLKKHGHTYHQISDAKTLERVYDEYFPSNTIDNLMYDDEYYLYIGNLHQINDDIEKAKEYYFMAMEKGNVNAIMNIAKIFSLENNKEQAINYYLMAYDYGNKTVLMKLAILYEDVQNYEKAKEFYLMAIENGKSDAIFNLALLYDDVEKNYEMAKVYYLMAIEKAGDVNAMYNLAYLYYDVENNIEKAIEYYSMAVEKGGVDAIFHLAKIYKKMGDDENLIKYALMFICCSKSASSKTKKYNINNLLTCETVISLFEKNEHYRNIDYFKKLYQFHISRKSFIKQGTCDICQEDDKSLYPYDCMYHFMCINCYDKVPKCGLCKCTKNPFYEKLLTK